MSNLCGGLELASQWCIDRLVKLRSLFKEAQVALVTGRPSFKKHNWWWEVDVLLRLQESREQDGLIQKATEEEGERWLE